jgi:hypothetical protein
MAGPGANIFSNGQLGGQQILGMLYAIENNPGGPPNTSKGGTLDLYFWESNNQSIGTGFTANDLLKRGQGGSRNGPSGSSRPSEYAGFTCPLSTAGCTFLARFDLGAGADLNSQIKTIINPAGTSTYDSYLQVDHSVVGNWTDSMDSNFFTLNPANAVCGNPLVSCRQANDMRSRGEFTHAGAEGWDRAGQARLDPGVSCVGAGWPWPVRPGPGNGAGPDGVVPRKGRVQGLCAKRIT